MLKLGARARNLAEARVCLDLGFDLLEITLPCPGGAAEEQAWSELGAGRNLRLLGHGPEEGDPGDLNHLEKEYLPRLRAGLEAARRLGVGLLTVHVWLDSRWLRPGLPAHKIALLGRVVEWGARVGVQVNLENLSETRADLRPALLRLPALGLTLDLGHAQLLHPRNTAPELIAAFSERISHLHLHDNHGGQSPRDDLHLVPGQGRVPFVQIFSALIQRGYSRTATLELAPEELGPARAWVRAAWDQAAQGLG